jgi:rhombotail lipoprotein
MIRTKSARFFMIALISTIILSLVVSACTGLQRQTRQSSSVVEYLYPDKKNIVVTPSMPILSLPVRAGIAFVPEASPSPTGSRLSEKQKLDIMDQIAGEFAKYPFIKSVERIPSSYIQPKGGFTNLDQIRTMYGIDIIALISYDQVQHTDEDLLSLTYWTIIGAYLVKGERNDTSTMMDTAVYDIASRKLLFRAPGTSQIKASATPINLSEQLRKDSYQGFIEANKLMVANLHGELERFMEKVKTKPQEYKVVHEAGYKGGGAFDLVTTALIALFGGIALWFGRRRR